MATLNIFGGNITFQNVTLAQGGSSENLLINPRGVINQAGESDGVLAANQYFCDGWKAGANGAEVYRDPDGFRLVSGSIVQIVENTLTVGSVIRANLDVLSGAPVMTLGGDSGAHTVADAAHIPLEISGTNCKFSRAIVAEGAELPIYAERHYADELARCGRFYFEDTANPSYVAVMSYRSTNTYWCSIPIPPEMKAPAVQVTASHSVGSVVAVKSAVMVSSPYAAVISKIVADARL